MLTVYRITEDMDSALMASLRVDLEKLAEGEGDVEMDLKHVSFIDSSGIGGIVFLYKRLAQQGRKLMVVNLSGQPLQMFNYLRLTELVVRTAHKTEPELEAAT
jgi:anti-sigma B factor antagonist